MSTRQTTFGELYNTLGVIQKTATGRDWWRKGGIQAIPKEAYATIMLDGAPGLEHPIVEDVADQQVPWGEARVEVKVEFFKGDAREAALRFRNALNLVAREWDLWLIASRVSAIQLIDVAAAFRVDIEPRAEIRVTLTANIRPETMLEDTSLDSIASVDIDLTHVSTGGVEDGQTYTITAPVEES